GGTFETSACACVELATTIKDKDDFTEALVTLEHEMCEELEDCCSDSGGKLSAEDQDAADDAGQDIVDKLRDYGCTVDEAVQCSATEPWSCDMEIPCDGARLAALGVRAQADCSSAAACRMAAAPAGAAAPLTFAVASQRSYVRASGPF